MARTNFGFEKRKRELEKKKKKQEKLERKLAKKQVANGEAGEDAPPADGAEADKE